MALAFASWQTHRKSFAVMTMGFTVFMPFAMGCITVYFAEIGEPRRVWTWIWLPWVPFAPSSATSAANIESIIVGLAAGAAYPYALKYTGKFWEIHRQYHLLGHLATGIGAARHYSQK